MAGPDDKTMIGGFAGRPDEPHDAAVPPDGNDAYAPPPRWRLLAGLGLLGLALVLWLVLPDAARANGRVVALQLIADPADADALDVGRGPVFRSLVFDAVLIGGYVLTLSWLALFTGRFFRVESLRRRREYVAWLVVAAGVADVVEDLLLVAGVASGYSTGGAFPALWTVMAMLAWAKFIALAVALGFLVAGAAGWATTRSQPGLWPVLWGQGDERSDSIEEVLDRQGEAERRPLGISLSGGGIRSASISLGTLQALERPDLDGDPMGWWQAAEVTAISGGSNMAAAWSITRSARYGDPKAGEPGLVDGSPDAWSQDPESDVMTPEEQHLMENLGYLASRTPRGDASDPTSPAQDGPDVPPPVPSWRPSSYATVFSGFLVNALLLLLCLWLAALPLGWFFGWLATLPGGCPDTTDLDTRLGCLAGESQLVVPTVLWLLVGLVGTVAWVGAGRVATSKTLLVSLRLVMLAGWGIGLAMLAVLVAFPYLMLLAGQAATGNASVLSVLGALGSLGAVARILRKPVVKYAPVVGGLAFGALVLFLTAYWANGAATRSSLLDGAAPLTDGAFGWYGVTWWLIGVAVIVALWWLVSPESWSMAPFYRGKLRLAYATFRHGRVAWPYANDSAEEEHKRWEPSLHTYLTRAEDPARGTPLTVCASCTVSNRGVKTHYGVPALSTTFTPESVTMFVPEDDLGRWRSWTCDSAAMDQLSRRGNGSRLTTMLAVAISSAAVAPAMGRYRVGPTSMLLTFANMRLGVWMPNPRYVGQLSRQQLRMPMVRLGYLFKEFFGLHDPSDLFVYLTDGGHWENTGLVELLRKGDYREVVCVDADPGPGDAVKSISEAIDLAYLECGARVHLNLDPLRAAPGNGRAPEYSERSVSVGFFESAAGHVGLLWYTKPALTQDMPASLLAHRETHPDFPRTSTLDQFFDLSTFIAYRNLGRHNARVIRTARDRLLRDMDAAYVAWQHRTGPDGKKRHADPFEAFCELEDCGWAARELAGLILRRAGVPSRRLALWQQVYDTLREAEPDPGPGRPAGPDAAAGQEQAGVPDGTAPPVVPRPRSEPAPGMAEMAHGRAGDAGEE